MFDFQMYLTTKETPLILPMTVQVDNQEYILNSKNTLSAFVDKYFKPQSFLEKYYLSFREVDAEKPSKCRH